MATAGEPGNDRAADRYQRKAALIERCAQQRVEALQLKAALEQRFASSSGVNWLARFARLTQWARDNRSTFVTLVAAALVPALLLKRRLAMGVFGRLFAMMSPLVVSRVIQRFSTPEATRNDRDEPAGAQVPLDAD